LRIIFAGTPHFAATHLRALSLKHEVIAVYTQPDRPAGRGKKITASPVKLLAEELGLQIYQPVSLKDFEQQSIVISLQADIMVVVAYGLMLPQAVLQAPRMGCINVHGSILPRWRGAAPIQRSVEAGDLQSGVTIMQMDVGLDTGPMLSITRCPIATNETSGSLYDKLAELGAPALLTTLDSLEAGDAVATAQDNNKSTYAHKIDKTEALINWSDSADIIDRRIRAFNPFPAAYTELAGLRVKIWGAQVASSSIALPGQIMAADSAGLLVSCGQSALLMTEIQLAGKSRMAVSEILKSRAELFAVGKQFDQ
jgi:methionyl-tRNA formyltransferase